MLILKYSTPYCGPPERHPQFGEASMYMMGEQYFPLLSQNLLVSCDTILRARQRYEVENRFWLGSEWM